MRRWIHRTALCLILGAISTVAVAWGCACVPRNRPSFNEVGRFESHATAPLWNMDQLDGFGFSRVLWMVMLAHFPGADMRRVDPPDWTRVVWGRQPTEAVASEYIVETASGWPAFALASFGTVNLDSLQLDVSCGIALEGLQSWEDADLVRIVPFGPIWPGFLIDTLFYAAIWFGVFFGFTGAKKLMRVRRGRCPRCGYDLRGQRAEVNDQKSEVNPPHPRPLQEGEGVRAGCPECGWRRGADSQSR